MFARLRGERAEVHQRCGCGLVQFVLSGGDERLGMATPSLVFVSERGCYEAEVVRVGGDAAIVADLPPEPQGLSIALGCADVLTPVLADRCEAADRIEHGAAIPGSPRPVARRQEVALRAVKLGSTVEARADIPERGGHGRGVAKLARELEASAPVRQRSLETFVAERCVRRAAQTVGAETETSLLLRPRRESPHVVERKRVAPRPEVSDGELLGAAEQGSRLDGGGAARGGDPDTQGIARPVG